MINPANSFKFVRKVRVQEVGHKVECIDSLLLCDVASTKTKTKTTWQLKATTGLFFTVMWASGWFFWFGLRLRLGGQGWPDFRIWGPCWAGGMTAALASRRNPDPGKTGLWPFWTARGRSAAWWHKWCYLLSLHLHFCCHSIIEKGSIFIFLGAEREEGC